MTLPRRSASWWATLAVVLCTVVLSLAVLWKDDANGWRTVIRSDAKGYYSYLTSLFLRHDLGHEPPAWEYVHGTPSGTLNKYFCGTSIGMAPWFALGHACALLDPDAPRNGYSAYEMKAIVIGGWVYLLLGLLALRALLRGLGVRDAVVAWTILALGLGTTLAQYAGIQPGWSHIHSFCAISAFLLVVHRLATGGTVWWSVAAAALLGLIVLIRPVNGLVLLAVPIVTGMDVLPMLARLLERWGVTLCAIVAGAAVVAIQPVLWHAQTGHWFEWGYRNEGFYWDRPMVSEVLFGIRRGLFVWTPVLLLPLIGAVLLWRRDRVRSAFAVLYWATNTYVIGCWWIWYYGSGFGSRVFIDHFPVLVIPMALVLHHASQRWWTIARAFLATGIALYVLQYTQYRMDILHHENMDREKYAWSFLRFGEAYRDKMGGCFEEAPYHPHGADVIITEGTDLERKAQWWTGGEVIEHPAAFSGRHVVRYTANSEFGASFNAPPGTLPLGRELWLEVSAQCYEAKAGDSFHALGIASLTRRDGSSAFYKPFRIGGIPGQQDSTWRALHYRIPVPALHEGEKLSFYIWNQDLRAHFLLDDLVIRVYAVRP